MRVTALTVVLWAAVAVTVLLLPVGPASATVVLAVAAVTALGEAWAHQHPWGSTSTSFTIREVGAVAGLLLLPPRQAVLAVALGLLASHLRNRAPVRKVAFNVGAAALATAVAAAVLVANALPIGTAVVPNGPQLGTAVLAVVALVAVDVVGYLALLVALDPRWSPRAALAQNDLRTAAISLLVGQTTLVLVHLLVTAPAFAVLLGAVLLSLLANGRAAARMLSEDVEQRSTRERLGALVATSSDGVVVADERGEVVLVNPAASRLLGRDAQELTGGPLSAVFEGTQRLPRRERAGGGYELQLPDADEPDGVRVLGANDQRLVDERGVPLGRVLVLVDETRARRLERMREDVLARVSHELRTPLTPILGYAVLLARKLEDEPMREAADAIARNARRLEDLVDQLLAAADAEPSRSIVTREVPVDDIVAVASARVADARARGNHGVTLLAADPADAVVAGDLDAISRIVGALLENAVLHTAEGTAVEVTVRCDDDAGCTTVGVVDHGPGLPAPLEELAEPFGRRDSALRQRTGGLGLGLHRATRLAEAMGATLTASTTPGGGATVELRLPARAPTHQPVR